MKPVLYSLLSFILLTPAFVFAQGKVYSPLVNIPSQGNQQMSFEAYISFLYGMSISIAALLAVVKIVIAGAKYMLSDVISTKGEAISDIQGAILGLLLIISAVVILELINPNLTARSITFPKLQSERPVSSPVKSAGQIATELTTGVDSCLTTTSGTSADKLKNRIVANASGCSGPDVLKQLELFQTNCAKQSGVVKSLGTGSKQVSCEIEILGAKEVVSLSDKLIAAGRVGEENIFIDGSKISVNIHNGCYATAQNVEPDRVKSYYESCLSARRSELQTPCVKEGSWGKFSTSDGGKVVTCQAAKEVKTVSQFQGYDPNFPKAIPSKEKDFEEACKNSGGTYIEDAVTNLVGDFFSPDNDRCVFY